MDRSSPRAPRLISSLCLVALLASHAPPASAQGKPAVTVSDKAKRHFQSGVDFLTDPDGARYEEALREFRAAYADSPSWKILSNLGLSAMKLERNGEAIEAYERYLAEAGKEIDPGEKTQIEKDLRLMKASSARLTLSAQGATGEVIVVDQRAKPNGTVARNTYTLAPGKPLTVLVQSGHHVLSAKNGSQEVRWESELEPGKQADHTFTFDASKAPSGPAKPPADGPGAATQPPPPQPQAPARMRPLRMAGIGTAGLGGALLVGGVITGLVGRGKLSDLEGECVNKQCPPGKKGEADSIESLQTATNVLLVAGGVLAAAGVTMIVLGKPADTTAAARPRPSLMLAPQLGPQGAGFWATGRF